MMKVHTKPEYRNLSLETTTVLYVELQTSLLGRIISSRWKKIAVVSYETNSFSVRRTAIVYPPGEQKSGSTVVLR